MLEHGTRSTYIHYGCRCRKCKEANSEYYQRRYGKNRRLVDVDEVLSLHDAGYSCNEIDRTLGFSHGVASKHLRLAGISTGKGVTVDHEVACRKCGEVFVTNNATRAICDKCKTENELIHQTANCKRCGKPFVKKNRKHAYCSRECKKADERKHVTYERKHVTYEHECRVCGRHFVDNQKSTVYCSDECRNFKPIRTVECCWCGKEFETDRNGKRYCSPRCISKAAQKRREMRIRTGSEVDEIPLTALYERDGGVCQICGGQTDWNDHHYNDNGFFVIGPSYPTHDHIIPIAKGGTHTWANSQLAHKRCNELKSASMPEDTENTDDQDGGRYTGWHSPGTAESPRAGHRGHHRHGRRGPQHGAARKTVPRDDTRNRRVGSGVR